MSESVHTGSMFLPPPSARMMIRAENLKIDNSTTEIGRHDAT